MTTKPKQTIATEIQQFIKRELDDNHSPLTCENCKDIPSDADYSCLAWRLAKYILNGDEKE